MDKKNYLIITFKTATMALYMEKTCKSLNVQGRIIPLPKQIDAGCGLVWATEIKDTVFWKNFLSENSINYDKITEVSF